MSNLPESPDLFVRTQSIPACPRGTRGDGFQRGLPFLLGIGGGSGSGKSTLANAAQTSFGHRCALIEQDRYYRDLSYLPHEDRAKTDFDSVEALDNDLLCRHLRSLKQGESISVPWYDFATHTRRPETEAVGPADVILLVGILVFSDARIRGLLDATVFVEAPACVRFLRRLVRDLKERGRTLDSVVAQYLSTVRPAHQRTVEPDSALADLVVSGQRLDSALLAVTQLVAGRTCGQP